MGTTAAPMTARKLANLLAKKGDTTNGFHVYRDGEYVTYSCDTMREIVERFTTETMKFCDTMGNIIFFVSTK
jgi:hypothetical protein